MTGQVFLQATDKGGVGKTGLTCQGAIYNALVLGKKVLLIDIEPQANASRMLEAVPQKESKYASLLFAPCDTFPIVPGKHGVDVIPADHALNGLPKDNALILQFLKNIKVLREQYDAIFFDVPPSGEPLLTSAYAAATDVVGLLTCDTQSIMGLENFVGRMLSFKKKVNPSMRIKGFVVNLYDPRRAKQRQLLDKINDVDVIRKNMMCAPIQNFSWIADCIDYCEPAWQKVRGSTAQKAKKQLLAFLKATYGSKK